MFVYKEIRHYAVINLLLISGCASTWANMSQRGLKALAACQLLLSSIVCFIGGVSLAHGLYLLLKHRRGRKASQNPESTQGSECVKAREEVHVHVDATHDS